MGLPVHLHRFVTAALDQLPHGLVCISENHKRTSGRLIALELLKSRAVANFFIEYHPSGGGEDLGFELLNGAFYQYAKNFRRLHGLVPQREDKPPKTAEELRERALGQADIIERLFDTMPECATDAKPRLQTLAYIGLQRGVKVIAADPLIKRGVDDVPGRNSATADMIHAKLQGNGGRSLLLWGALHFEGAEGIHALLEQKGYRVDVIDVSNVA